MNDYLKYYSNYFGITWDHQKFEVHHIDGIRSNNRISNLILLPRELHRRLHKYGFDLDRYETQILQIATSDQRIEDLKALISILDECRRWAFLRAVDYKLPSGELIGEITERTEL